MHPNPRTAEVCSRCGSHDLSLPQPRVPLWVPILERLASVIPGTFLGLISFIIATALLVAVVQRPAMIAPLVLLAIPLGILWGMWTELPKWFRNAVFKLLKRRREHGPTGER